jgi:hypothetical protein
VARVEGFEVGQSGLEPIDDNGNPVSVGVWGDSDNGMGVFGSRGQLPPSTTFPVSQPAGVVGNSVDDFGVWGESLNSTGVAGRSLKVSQTESTYGVLGISFSPAGSGVAASNTGGGDGVDSFVGDGTAVLGSSHRTGTGVVGGNFSSFFGPATGVGVDGYSDDSGIGVRGESPNGTGVYGSSDIVGVHGHSPTNGLGVYGSSDNGLGVWGYSNTRAGVYGSSNVVGVQGYSSNGVGAQGSSDNNVGVLGSSPNSVGVQGSSNNHVGVSGEGIEGEGVVGTSFTNNGLRGLSWTATGAEGTSIIGYGVTGYNYGSEDREDPPGAGVLGSSNRDPGVIGASHFGTGVVGDSDLGLAGDFFGSVRIRGNLFLHGQLIHFLHAGPAHYRIDHPMDPANKYLNHASIASPEMKNVYDGVVELGEDGTARVELPEWFGELNEDFRYQLTPIGASAPGLYVTQEIAGNRFGIAGGEPNMKVSWQVTGIVQGRWAADRFEVEQQKASEERGRYLRPELFGQPQEARIDMDPHREEQLQEIKQRLEQQPPPRLPSVAFAAGDEEQIRRVQELTRQAVGQEPLPAEQPLPAEASLPPEQPLLPDQPPPIDPTRHEEKRRQVEELVSRLRGGSASEAQEEE